MLFRKLTVVLSFSILTAYGQNNQPHVSDFQTDPQALQFILMGDWGRKGTEHQKTIADQMAGVAADANVDFVITTGDNFYENGVSSVTDRHWKSSYEEVYTAPSLQCAWYPTLGNHDYGLNPDAQVEYSTLSKRWHMPARYYSKTFILNNDSTQQALFVFIDTTPLIPFYYRGSNVHRGDQRRQKRWIKNTLSGTSSNVKWKFVVGHHPMYTAGGRTNNHDTKSVRRKLQAVFRKNKVNAYLAGHEHNLQHLVSEDRMHHFISGAGSEITPVNKLPISRFVASDYGFMLISLSTDKYIVQVINQAGEILYTTEVYQ